jgi:hypothetical protein
MSSVTKIYPSFNANSEFNQRIHAGWNLPRENLILNLSVESLQKTSEQRLLVPVTGGSKSAKLY